MVYLRIERLRRSEWQSGAEWVKDTKSYPSLSTYFKFWNDATTNLDKNASSFCKKQRLKNSKLRKQFESVDAIYLHLLPSNNDVYLLPTINIARTVSQNRIVSYNFEKRDARKKFQLISFVGNLVKLIWQKAFACFPNNNEYFVGGKNKQKKSEKEMKKYINVIRCEQLYENRVTGEFIGTLLDRFPEKYS